MNKKNDYYIDAEEIFYNKEKASKKNQRKTSKKPQYKTTNKPTIKTETASDATEGRVLSIAGEIIIVEGPNHHQYNCTLRGILKKDKTNQHNIVAVGDIVQFSPSTLTIESINKRKTILSRENIRLKKQQIIAVNIDQVLITVSANSPMFKPFLVDRYIIATIKGNMTPVIIINKIDLMKQGKNKEKTKLQAYIDLYHEMERPLILTSTKTKKGISQLKKIMKNKASVFSGQSGVGKSSLINIVAKTNLKTGEVSLSTSKGSHITTKSHLIPLKSGGFCIDTPGIKSFGIWSLTRKDIDNYFYEIKKLSSHCKYQNCCHINEPKCAVIQAVKENKISPLRFDSYHCLMKEILKS
jgi:ribosome biogenesis GTPase / thiamine phosphate phosphatase